jgi:hypothetical protein
MITRKKARIGAVTLIQRLVSALNIHLHMLFLDATTDPTKIDNRSRQYSEKLRCRARVSYKKFRRAMKWGPSRTQPQYAELISRRDLQTML